MDYSNWFRKKISFNCTNALFPGTFPLSCQAPAESLEYQRKWSMHPNRIDAVAALWLRMRAREYGILWKSHVAFSLPAFVYSEPLESFCQIVFIPKPTWNSGKYLPACRITQTGTRSTSSPRAARNKLSFFSAGKFCRNWKEWIDIEVTMTGEPILTFASYDIVNGRQFNM